MLKNILIAAAFGAAAVGAHANDLSNGSFESNSLGGAEYCYGCSATDWNVALLITSGSGAWGNPSATAGGFDLGSTIAGIQGGQVMSSNFSFVAGQTYTLTWDDAGRRDYAAQTYTVSAGGVTFADFGTAAGQAWSAHSETFTATSNGVLTFAGHDVVDGTSFIDNVSVTAVPEPTSLMLMLVGSLGLVAWRRRAQV